MILAYARVSTALQNTEKFRPALQEAGAEEIIEEQVTGKKSWKRRELAGVLDRLSKGDILLTPELTRLGRDLFDMLDFVKHAREKGVTIRSLKDNLNIGPLGDAAGELQFHMMAALAQFERSRLSERTKEGLERARAQGKQLGGYRGHAGRDLGGRNTHPHKNAALKAIANGGTVSGTARAYGITRTTLYRWLRESASCNKTT